VTEATTAVLAVRKSLVVKCSVERAFEVFTREIGTWWPLDKHSIGEAKITEVVFEEMPGGRVFERHEDGTEEDWGKVLAFEPPHMFAMSWSPGSDPAKATRLEVRFAADGKETRVDLEHTGWEILAESAEETRSNYDGGWEGVLGYYTRYFDA
jgi:uncharacterized protein YndB with AHSA1/START domain